MQINKTRNRTDKRVYVSKDAISYSFLLSDSYQRALTSPQQINAAKKTDCVLSDFPNPNFCLSYRHFFFSRTF